MTPDPQAIRDAADRAEQLRADAQFDEGGEVIVDPMDNERVTYAGMMEWCVAECDGPQFARLIAATPELLSVLVPAARTAADLLDAVGDPEDMRGWAALVDDYSMTGGGYLRRIADAAAAARGEQ